MKIHRKMIICTAFILLSIFLITGCEEKHSPNEKVTSMSLTQQKTAAQQKTSNADELFSVVIKSMANPKRVAMIQGTPAAIIWVPKNQKTTLSEVTSLLQQAKQYKGEIPKSNVTWEVISNANTNPSTLNIMTSDNHDISIQPAWYLFYDKNLYYHKYIADVISIRIDEQIIYIQSSKLYDWLKNDKWQAEFKS